MGGVHLDASGTNEEIVRDLADLGELLEHGGIGSVFSVLLLLARATYTGLEPPYEAVKKA